MNNQQLNRTLAEWAGFKYQSYQVYEYEHKDTRIEDPYWSNPKGREIRDLPDFTQSLDSCFKWLVPKLRELKYYIILRDISGAYHCSLVYTTAEKRSWYGESDTPALALCLAILELIENR